MVNCLLLPQLISNSFWNEFNFSTYQFNKSWKTLFESFRWKKSGDTIKVNKYNKDYLLRSIEDNFKFTDHITCKRRYFWLCIKTRKSFVNLIMDEDGNSTFEEHDIFWLAFYQFSVCLWKSYHQRTFFLDLLFNP